MSLWKYNDAELEIDMEDVEFQEKYENAFSKMEESEKDLQNVGKISDFSKKYCGLFYNLFDDLFGSGTGKKLMGNKMNTGKCEECYNSFIAFCAEQVNEINRRRAATLKKYVPKRK